MIDQLEVCLKEFDALRSNDSLPMHYIYDGGASSFRVQICGIIHGNEVGSLPTIIQLIKDLESKRRTFSGKISICLGNPEAARLNRRFIDADLNRLFLSPQPKQHRSSHEGKRAKELMPILSECDLLLDLHQTNLASKRAFFIFPNSPLSEAWARTIGGTNAYVNSTPTTPNPSYQCSDDFIWSQGKPALTLELGKAGFHESAQRVSTTAIDNLLSHIDQLVRLGIEHNNEATLQYLKGIDLGNLEIFTTVHREPYHTINHQLRDGLINFHPVEKGDVLSAQNTPMLLAPLDGVLLFPKYPSRDHSGQINETLPKEIFRIIQRT